MMSNNLRMREEHTITSGTMLSGVLTGPYFSDPDSDSDSESDSDKRPHSEPVTISPLGFASW